jgi:hypothetical protein
MGAIEHVITETAVAIPGIAAFLLIAWVLQCPFLSLPPPPSFLPEVLHDVVPGVFNAIRYMVSMASFAVGMISIVAAIKEISNRLRRERAAQD